LEDSKRTSILFLRCTETPKVMLYLVTALSRKFLLRNIRILYEKQSLKYIVLKVFLYIDMPSKIQRNLLCT